MAVRIRLTRLGKKANPKYRIVAIDKRNKRDGKVLEILGLYDPTLNPPKIELKKDRIEFWVKNGAQTSESVQKLLKI